MPHRQAPFVFLLLVAAILAVTWPWAAHFASATLEHWDPPFHAWKLELLARAILSGRLIPEDGNTNMYYPHSAALYFEALHWPQALLAAGLFAALGEKPLLVYHIVLVAFWALSGLCMWLLLLALGSTRPAALLGALLFTLMPYRISYMVEFNMQLSFGVPLFLFFMVRFFQRPAVLYACGAALAWWAQAASELYQAVFLLLILPFPALALLAADSRLLLSFRRFWMPMLCAAALAGALSFILLSPYLTLFNVHLVNRKLYEISRHILEPLSYLRQSGRFTLLPRIDAKQDEMNVYPTITMLALSVAFVCRDAWRARSARTPPAARVLRHLRQLTLLLFMAITLLIYFFPAAGGVGAIAECYAYLPIAAVLISAALLSLPPAGGAAPVFIAGFFSSAVLAFFLSFGPAITIRHANFSVENVLYLWIYKYLSFLHGFRVVSRFSLYVLSYMVIASAKMWSVLERRLASSRVAMWLLWLAALAPAVVESLPMRFAVRPLKCPLATPVLEWLDGHGEPYVLAAVPMGERFVDSRHMLQIARYNRLFVYAWGGAYPRYTQEVRDAMRLARPDPQRAAALLRQLWPECFILEDKAFSRPEGKKHVNFAEIFSSETDLVAEDERFALLRLKPTAEPQAEHIRLVRRDLLRKNPVAQFQARTADSMARADLWLDLNGYPVGRWEIGPEPAEFQVLLPETQIIHILPNRLRFHAEADAPFFLERFTLAPAPTNMAAAAGAVTNACPPWSGHLHSLPPGVVPLDIRYQNGFEILAFAPLATAVAPGGALKLKYFVRCPRDMQLAASLFLTTRVAGGDGEWLEERLPVAEAADLNDIACQPHKGIYALETLVPVPAGRLPAGECELFVLLRNAKGKRLAGRSAGRRATLFKLPATARILAEPAAAAAGRAGEQPRF